MKAGDVVNVFAFGPLPRRLIGQGVIFDIGPASKGYGDKPVARVRLPNQPGYYLRAINELTEA